MSKADSLETRSARNKKTSAAAAVRMLSAIVHRIESEHNGSCGCAEVWRIYCSVNSSITFSLPH